MLCSWIDRLRLRSFRAVGRSAIAVCLLLAQGYPLRAEETSGVFAATAPTSAAPDDVSETDASEADAETLDLLAAALQPPTPPSAGADSAPALPPVDVVVEEPEPVDLTPRLPQPVNPFNDTVYDSPFFAAPVEGYAPGSTTTAAKIRMGIVEFPGIVNTVTEDLIQDRQSITFDQALRTVPNVSPRTGAGFRSDEFYIRGFNVGFSGNDFRKDGFRDSSWVSREVQNIERIEVLKGPASVLYGNASQPAGLINVVTKKPLNEDFADIDQQFGSFGLLRTTGDVNSRMFGSENALARVNFAIQDSESFRDFVFVDRYFLAPAFSFVVDADTVLTVQGEWLHDSRMVDRGITFVPATPAGDPLALPINRFFGQPTDRSNYEDGQFNVFLNREVFDGLNARLGYVSNWSGEQRNNYDTRGLVGNNIVRQFVLQRSMVQDHYFIGDISAEWGNDLVNHRALVGAELGTSIADSFSRQGANNSAPLNIFDPFNTPGANYSLYPQQPALGAPLTSGSQQDNYGVYAQDMIQITPYFKTLLGVRGNWVDQKSFSNATGSQQQFDAVTPRYGIVIEPVPEDLSFYVAYSETFNVVQGFAAGPTPGSVVPLDPESGWGFDVGTKARLRDDLYLTVGYFDIERTNVAQAVPGSVPPVSVQFGVVRSTGMEIELLGQINDRWSIITGYGMADARIENDRVAANVGQRLPHSPYWQGSVWTRYNVIQNRDLVAGFGLGMYYTDRFAITAGAAPFILPAYQRYDMGFFFDIGRWRSAVFIENFTDELYASGGNTANLVAPGAPVNARGTIGVSF